MIKILTFILFIPSLSWADVIYPEFNEKTGKFADYTKDKVKPFLGVNFGRYNASHEANSAFMGGVEAGFEFQPAAVYLSWHHVQSKTNDDIAPVGTFTLTPLMVNMDGIARFKAVSVRFGLCVGALLTDFELDKLGKWKNEVSFEKTQVSVDNEICWKLGGGLEWPLNSHISVGVTVSMFFAEPWIETTRTNSTILYNNKFVSRTQTDFNSVLGMVTFRFR